MLAKYGLMVQKLINQFSSTTKQEYLPDLVKQIIQEHILPEFDRGTQEESKWLFRNFPVNTTQKQLGYH